jgi:hydrogenase maturation factor
MPVTTVTKGDRMGKGYRPRAKLQRYPALVDPRLPTGKLPPDLLEEVLGRQPALPAEVRLGPGVGEDACAIDVDTGTLVVATDPITLTGNAVGAHAVAINANDVAVMGVRPRWFLAAVLFPEHTPVSDVRGLFAGMREALASLDVALVGGHTEVTSVVSQTVVVGQMLGMAERGRVISTGGMRPGDTLLQVGPAPVEGAAVLAAAASPALGSIDASLLAAARDAIRSPGISVVAAALLAADLGANALHDPTEGGLATGLHEMADASGAGIEVDATSVLWFGPGRALCAAVGADPWGTLASGTLLASFPEARAEQALQRMRDAGHLVARIGTAHESEPGVAFKGGDALPRFDRDELSRVL